MKYQTNSLLILALFFIIQGTYAQESPADIIRKAMADELRRSMDSLKYKDFEKPFFIAYKLADISTLNISATLGALLNSEKNQYKDQSVRVMVGDYQINDENFINYSSFGQSYFINAIPTPKDADYFGIRRSLWASTDNVYKSAGEIYKSKLATLEQHKIPKEDYKIPDFAKAPTVELEIPTPEFELEKDKWEHVAREVSAVFKDYSEISTSEVNIGLFKATAYFINSEGTKVSCPVTLAAIQISGSVMVVSGSPVNDNVVYYSLTPDNLPLVKEMKKDVAELAENLIALQNAEPYEDSYSGPVLFEGEAAAELFSHTLFGHNGLTASREEMSGRSDMISIPDKPSGNSIEAKIGKKIISKDLTVKAVPGLKEYNGIKLIGSVEVDGEGVIPPDELILIESGILQTLLNGRTPSIMVRESNGHNRFTIHGRGLSRRVGPSVIEITSTKSMPKESLKQKLIELAEEEDLEYAFIIRKAETGSFYQPVNIYKVNVKDGNEELVRSVTITSLAMKSLKKAECVSDSIIVFNTMISGGYRGMSMYGESVISGIPSSFIVPDAVLIKELEIQGAGQVYTNKLPVLENPVGK
ncbi:MAG: hypothetical protein ISS18_15815 [Bacteroidales bacterium]|nr:hypothetical protein [Bacteroidales bacterium]